MTLSPGATKYIIIGVAIVLALVAVAFIRGSAGRLSAITVGEPK